MKVSTSFSRLRVIAAKSPIMLLHQAPTSFSGAFFVLAFAILLAGTSSPTASAQTVTYAGTGAVNFGSINVCPSGKTTPAPCSKTLTLTYNVTEGGTLAAPQALTTGAPNLDYKLASGSTCTGSVTKGNTCTANVAFAPIAPGVRKGAVEIVDTTGNVLATTYIYGSGIAPLEGFGNPPQINIGLGSGYHSPLSVVVDAAGDVFVSDEYDYTIKELLAVNGSLPPNPVIKILNAPIGSGLAIDGAGNIFTGSLEIFAAGGYIRSRSVGGPGPGAVSFNMIGVDAIGNVFTAIPDPSGENGYIEEFTAASDYTAAKILGNGISFFDLYGLAVDGSGNVYVSYGSYGYIDEFLASDDYQTVRTIQANCFTGLAVDPAGNIFGGGVIDAYTQQAQAALAELLAVDGVVPETPTTLYFGQGSLDYEDIDGVALDGRGNVFTTDSQYGLVQERQFSSISPLTFANTVVGHTSSDSPQIIPVQNQGTANLELNDVSLTGPNWSLVAGGGTPPDCASSNSLAPGAACDFNISFNPTQLGALTGSLTFVDNSLNAPGSSQSFPLSGTGIPSSSAPHISKVTNTYGAPYSVVYLTGTNFGATQGPGTITFNGIAPPVYHWTNTNILVTVPPNATTGNIVVTADGVISNAIPFTVLPMPALVGFSPTSGLAGTVVSINGYNLLDYENKGIVTFSGKSLPILSDTSTAIKVAIPIGATTGDFHVLVNDTGMNTSTFSVTK